MSQNKLVTRVYIADEQMNAQGQGIRAVSILDLLREATIKADWTLLLLRRMQTCRGVPAPLLGWKRYTKETTKRRMTIFSSPSRIAPIWGNLVHSLPCGDLACMINAQSKGWHHKNTESPSEILSVKPSFICSYLLMAKDEFNWGSECAQPQKTQHCWHRASVPLKQNLLKPRLGQESEQAEPKVSPLCSSASLQ